MFQVKRPTAEIDAFIKHLSLDVATILLHATFHPPKPHRDPFPLPPSGIIILNHPTDVLDSSFHINSITTSTEIVSAALISILKQFSTAKENFYCPKNVGISSAFRSLSALQHKDCMENVASDDHRVSFLINVFNLLFIHSLVHAKFHGGQELLDNDVGQRVHFWRYRYHIGPFGLISLQDLYDELSPFRTSSGGKDAGKFGGPVRRKENGFLMANSEHVIDVRVLHGEMLQQQWGLAVAEYLARTVWYEKGKKIVHLPTWLFRVYAADKLMGLVRREWHGAGEVDFAEAILEPSGRVIRDLGLRFVEFF